MISPVLIWSCEGEARIRRQGRKRQTPQAVVLIDRYRLRPPPAGEFPDFYAGVSTKSRDCWRVAVRMGLTFCASIPGTTAEKCSKTWLWKAISELPICRFGKFHSTSGRKLVGESRDQPLPRVRSRRISRSTRRYMAG